MHASRRAYTYTRHMQPLRISEHFAYTPPACQAILSKSGLSSGQLTLTTDMSVCFNQKRHRICSCRPILLFAAVARELAQHLLLEIKTSPLIPDYDPPSHILLIQSYISHSSLPSSTSSRLGSFVTSPIVPLHPRPLSSRRDKRGASHPFRRPGIWLPSRVVSLPRLHGVRGVMRWNLLKLVEWRGVVGGWWRLVHDGGG